MLKRMDNMQILVRVLALVFQQFFKAFGCMHWKNKLVLKFGWILSHLWLHTMSNFRPCFWTLDSGWKLLPVMNIQSQFYICLLKDRLVTLLCIIFASGYASDDCLPLGDVILTDLACPLSYVIFYLHWKKVTYHSINIVSIYDNIIYMIIYVIV